MRRTSVTDDIFKALSEYLGNDARARAIISNANERHIDLPSGLPDVIPFVYECKRQGAWS